MKTFKEYINEVKKPTGQLKDACWSGYTAVGMKMKGGRKVPNCVPEEVEIQEEFKKGDRVRHNDGTLGTVTREPDEQGLVQWKHAGNKHRVSKKDVLKSAADEKFRWRQQKEEVEQIDEISQKTLSSYTAKAHKEYSDRLKNWPAKSAENMAKADKRWKGLTAAAKRGPKTHQVPAGKEPVDKSGRPYWGEETEQLDEKSAAWQRKEGKNPSGGLNAKGVASYRRENPGSKLKTAVTTKPSKLKPGSKAANRRKSFCARMGGMKKRLTSAKTARDPNSRINKSLRKWNC